MKIYRISKQYNQEIMKRPDYIGFHCQSRPRSKYDDIIKNDNNYADNYYLHILDILPFELQDQAQMLGLTERPEKYTEEFDDWAEAVHSFLQDHNIRWIFVSHNKPLSEHYGDYRYYVMLPSTCVLHIFDDPGVNDMAWAYVYDGNKCSPQCIALDDEEDGYEDI